MEIKVKKLKKKNDSMKIKQLTKQGVSEDAAKVKADTTMIEQLKKTIKSKDAAILEIKLELK